MAEAARNLIQTLRFGRLELFNLLKRLLYHVRLNDGVCVASADPFRLLVLLLHQLSGSQFGRAEVVAVSSDRVRA
jgi:hypothetical protein